jgi:hypothetical protein
MRKMNSISDILRRSKRIRLALVCVTLVALVLGLLHLKVSLDVERNYRPHAFDASYALPGPQVLRAATLNYRTAAADIVWVSGVQFVAKNVVAHRTADDVTHYAYTLVDLDPYFYKVYSWHSAARMLTAGYPSPEDIEAANDVLEVGMKHFPNDWRLPQEAVANYIGFNEGVGQATRIRQLERGIEFADAAAARSNGEEMPVFLGVKFRQRLAHLKSESSDSEAQADVPDADPDMLVRLYFQARSKIVRDSILTRLQQAEGSSKLTSKLRAYSEQQTAWYESADTSYVPLALFSTFATPPSAPPSDVARTDVTNDEEIFP